MQVKKKRNTKKKIVMALAVLVILTGIVIAVYPTANSVIFDYRQQDLINSWTLMNAGISHQNLPEIIPEEIEYEEDADINEIYEEDINAFFDFNYALQMMTGTLKIPDLNLTSPILIGDTEHNLNIGVCEVKGSAAPGGIGNYILAGHYSRIRGRHFNRLPEIQPGASVFISDSFRTFEYEVSEILQVKAEDTWAVPLNPPERMATLITCDYSTGEPYGRIIVKCMLKE